MNTYNIVLLIRSLYVLGMIGLLVVAGALIARRERRRAATPAPVAPTRPRQQSELAQRRQRDRSGQVESDDSALGIQRRAA
jgi:hypothetical protein